MFTIDKEKLGGFVAQLRKEQGLTQKEVAQRLFISDKAVSKWETGVLIPDTALLIPLAELLGVTVTELLLCRRQEEGSAMDPQVVEDVVKTAIAYPSAAPRRVWRNNGRWPVWYTLSLLLGGGELLIIRKLQAPMEAVSITLLLGIIFGAWFCFFALGELPHFYDENAICGVIDGPFRIHLVGLRLNNRNWPHILAVGRAWSCAVMAGLPALCLLLWQLWPELWPQLQLWVVLGATLGGLLIPVYLIGKRYE